MSMAYVRSGSRRLQLQHEEQLTFQVLVVVTFPIFLVAALAGCFSARRPGAQPRWALLARARAASSSTIPFIFMG